MRCTLLVTLVALAASAGSVRAEPVNCQKQIVKNLLKFKKTYLKVGKCLDSENVGKISGPCPDAATLLKIQTVAGKVHTKIELSCPAPDLTTLGFPASCAFEASPTGVETTCSALPVSTPGEFADCLMCWKAAELSGFVATLYASHAVELCGSALDETSSTCSELGCTTPQPDQRNLGDTGENDCQKAVGKGGIKDLVSVEKVLEKCGLLGNDRPTCLADPANQALIAKATLKFETTVQNKCGNRDPVPNTPYCCKTGQANACVASASRTDCEMNLGGTVQEGKVCGVGNTCDPLMGGGQDLTWWSTCPTDDTCTGALTTRADLVTCVEDMVDQRAQALLCIQFPSGWPCPPDASPSGAFIE